MKKIAFMLAVLCALMVGCNSKTGSETKSSSETMSSSMAKTESSSTSAVVNSSSITEIVGWKGELKGTIENVPMQMVLNNLGDTYQLEPVYSGEGEDEEHTFRYIVGIPGTFTISDTGLMEVKELGCIVPMWVEAIDSEGLPLAVFEFEVSTYNEN